MGGFRHGLNAYMTSQIYAKFYGHTYRFYRYISDISTSYTSSFVVRSRCFKKYQMMILSKRGRCCRLRQRFPSEGSGPPFPLPLYVRDRPYVHVGTLELSSIPLAWSLCSLFIPITRWFADLVGEVRKSSSILFHSSLFLNLILS